MKVARFLPEIFDDLAAASQYYDAEGGRELGDRFIVSFYSGVHRVSNTADAHRDIYGGFRRVLIQPFPYKLFFRVSQDDIVFALLIHAARDPLNVEKLLRSRVRGLG